jgi:hypothetical protein
VHEILLFYKKPFIFSMPLAIHTQVVGGGGDGHTKTLDIRKPDQVRITQSKFVQGRKQNAKKIKDKDHEHRSTTW